MLSSRIDLFTDHSVLYHTPHTMEQRQEKAEDKDTATEAETPVDDNDNDPEDATEEEGEPAAEEEVDYLAEEPDDTEVRHGTARHGFGVKLDLNSHFELI